MTDDLLARLRQVKPRGDNNWTALCPAHDDQRSSLSISRAEDGKWLLYCHATCSVDDIVTALGITLSDLFPAPAPSTAASPAPTVYRYVDEQGVPLYDVVRFAPKTFRQRLPDGTWGIGSVRRVLYRLSQLVGQVDVFIPEGEKDVDALWAHGLAATTNVGGAGKWRDEYAVPPHENWTAR